MIDKKIYQYGNIMITDVEKINGKYFCHAISPNWLIGKMEHVLSERQWETVRNIDEQFMSPAKFLEHIKDTINVSEEYMRLLKNTVEYINGMDASKYEKSQLLIKTLNGTIEISHEVLKKVKFD